MTLLWVHRTLSGRTTGRDHRLALRDGQDGVSIRAVSIPSGESYLGLAVTDGCGSASASEVGARLGAAFLASRGPEVFAAHEVDDADRIAQTLGEALLDYLREVVFGLATTPEARGAIVAEAFLFSFVVALGSERRTLVLAQGDGLALLDERETRLTAVDDTPAYLGYRLLPSERERTPLPEGLAPRVLFDGATSSIHRLALATDGAFALSTDELVSLRDQALASPNPSWLEKKLRALSEHGPLHDDTTLVACAFRGEPS
jgi:serine/threonine protein phosphatase PrpC